MASTRPSARGLVKQAIGRDNATEVRGRLPTVGELFAVEIRDPAARLVHEDVPGRQVPVVQPVVVADVKVGLAPRDSRELNTRGVRFGHARRSQPLNGHGRSTIGLGVTLRQRGMRAKQIKAAELRNWSNGSSAGGVDLNGVEWMIDSALDERGTVQAGRP